MPDTMRHQAHDRRLPATLKNAALALACLLLVSGGWPAPAPAAGEGAGGGAAPTDTNDVTPRSIRESYGKRFPFAADEARQDRVTDGKSESGGTETYADAYSFVIWFCNDEPLNPHPDALHIHYQQMQQQGSADLPSARDKAAFKKGWIKCYGLPMSDTQFQIIDRENRQRFLELLFDPERWMWKETAKSHMQTTSMANSVGAAAETSFQTAFDAINQSLINVANENAAMGGSYHSSGRRSLSQAVYIVQQMYKFVFVPMAVLFLLPGAVLTQVKGMVSRGFLGGGEDSTSPFEGILRAMIAIFLIPATQLIVSYAIDVGNSLADTVRDPSRQWIQENLLIEWASEQTFTPSPANAANAINRPGSQKGGGGGQPADSAAGDGGTPGTQGFFNGEAGAGRAGAGSFFSLRQLFGASGNNVVVDTAQRLLDFLFGRSAEPAEGDDTAGGEGKAAGELEGQVTQENQLWLSGAMQVGFNATAYLMGYSLTVLTAYQIVFMCYLFLLGPLAAAFYAWPSGVGSLFRRVFSNWVDAVVVLALWRFWWCVILAVMTQRILYLHPNPGSPAEMMVFNCFLALLMYIPFQPFTFNPGPMVSQVLDKAASGGGGGGGAGAHAPAAATGGSATGQTGTATTAAEPVSSTSGRESAAGADGGQGTRDSGGGGEGDGGEEQGQSGAAGRGGGPPPSREARRAAAVAVAPPPPSRRPLGASPAAAALAPPGSGGEPQGQPESPAALTLQQELGAGAVETVGPGRAPTVALAPRGRGARMLVATGNAALAKTGFRAWQQAAPAPRYLGGNAGVNPAAAASPAVAPPDASAAPAEAPPGAAPGQDGGDGRPANSS